METLSSYAPSEASAIPIALPAIPDGQRRLRAAAYLLIVAAFVAAIPFALRSNDLLRVLIAACIFLPLYACRTALTRITLVFLYLCVMGGLRRWMIPAWGFPNVDLLLLIVPVLTFLRFLG